MSLTMEIPVETMTEVYERASRLKGQERFADFRKIVHPDMLWGWWVERVSLELEGFYNRMQRGGRPKLAIMAPPQHGKSSAATDFIAWVAGGNPNVKTIF